MRHLPAIKPTSPAGHVSVATSDHAQLTLQTEGQLRVVNPGTVCREMLAHPQNGGKVIKLFSYIFEGSCHIAILVPRYRRLLTTKTLSGSRCVGWWLFAWSNQTFVMLDESGRDHTQWLLRVLSQLSHPQNGNIGFNFLYLTNPALIKN